MLADLNKWVIRCTNINAKQNGINEITESEYINLMYLWHCEGLVHNVSHKTYLKPNPKYAEVGYKFPDFSDRITP